MKSHRQKTILTLISEKNIETQEQLLKELQASGYKSTQATVSRDIKELRIIKTLDGMGGYRYCAAMKNEADHFDDRFRVIFRECVTKVDCAFNQIVIKTLSATAGIAAETIDGLHWPEILGTIAGENTILLIVRSVEDVQTVIERMNAMIRR